MSKMCIRPVTDLLGILQGGVRSESSSEDASQHQDKVSGKVTEVEARQDTKNPTFAFYRRTGAYTFHKFPDEYSARHWGMVNGWQYDGELSEDFYNRIKTFDNL